MVKLADIIIGFPLTYLLGDDTRLIDVFIMVSTIRVYSLAFWLACFPIILLTLCIITAVIPLKGTLPGNLTL